MIHSIKPSKSFLLLTLLGTSRSVVLATGIWSLSSLTVHALIDWNNNGISDLWEEQYNTGYLSSPFDSNADPDSDGWTNAKEAAAGTNPFEANPPNGYIQPTLEHYPTVYITGENGPEILTPELYTLAWPTLIGKQYTLLFSPALAAGSWLPIGPPLTATGTEALAGIPITQPDGTTPAAIFWRVAVSDIDNDGDTLTDAEERQLGTDSFDPDSDDDGTPDAADANSYINHPGAAPPGGGTSGGTSNGGSSSGGASSSPLEPLYMNFVRKNYSEFCITYPPVETEGTTYSGMKYKHSYTINQTITDDPVYYDIDLNTALASITSGISGVQYPPFEAIHPVMKAHASNCAEHGFGPSSYFNYSDFDEGDSSIRSGVASSSRFRLERLLAEDKVRTSTYLKLHGEYWWGTLTGIDSVKLTIPANALYSNEVEIKTDNNGSLCRLARSSINDNRPATGVDNISNTVENLLSSGYQELPWIMAPCGGTVSVGGVSFAMTNDMNINIGNSIAGPLEITCPDAKATPAVSSWVTGTDLIHTSWKGTGDTSGDKIPVFKFGTGSDQISAELPVRVKVMKKRTVKVAVWPVHHQYSNRVVYKPDKALLERRLNEIYGSQINVWFEVSYRAEMSSPYADKPDPEVSFYEARWSLPLETSMIQDQKFKEPDKSIVVFLIDNVSYYAGGGLATGGSYPTLNKSVVNVSWDSSGVIRSDEGIIHTIAHEIGHIMLGDGHPNVNDGGIAPLPGTDRTKRLMCDGADANPDSKLLVKTEWDKAELWLKVEEAAGRINP